LPPTSAHPTGGSVFSFGAGELPTPSQRDWKSGRSGLMAQGRRPLNEVVTMSLLPTPAAGNFNDGESVESWEARRQVNLAKGINGNGQGTPLAMAVQLLKTPTAQLAVNGGSQHPDKRIAGGHGPTLADQVEHLLPTPNTLDDMPPKTREQIKAHRDEGKGGDRNLREAVLYELPAAENSSRVEFSWGKYEAAIRRWEPILGRPAPNPTEPGKTAPRLSPGFTEWMQGLPSGWVTDTGISRKGQLRALGNGVVPQQAEMALRILLQGETHQ
jgi:hypothetical protein